MKIGNINSIGNGMLVEQHGSGNTMNNNQNDASTIFSDTTRDAMISFLEELRNLTVGSEMETVEEAEECLKNNDHQGLAAKLKKLGKKTLDIAKGIAESIAGGVLLNWLTINGIL